MNHLSLNYGKWVLEQGISQIFATSDYYVCKTQSRIKHQNKSSFPWHKSMPRIVRHKTSFKAPEPFPPGQYAKLECFLSITNSKGEALSYIRAQLDCSHWLHIVSGWLIVFSLKGKKVIQRAVKNMGLGKWDPYLPLPSSEALGKLPTYHPGIGR